LENDEYLRCIDGFLPTATVAFLDEIFKANSSILNTLLTILNERQFDNGAGKRVTCPLKCVIGASNELPESEELDALLDRFLLRANVKPVSDEGLLKILSRTDHAGSPPSIDIATELQHVVSDISLSIDNVSLDQSICVLIQQLRTFARDQLNMYLSDRRLVKAARLLRVSAVSNGRAQVDLVDCLLLEHIFWQIPEQQAAVREWMLDNLTPGNDIIEQSRFLLSGLVSEALVLVKKTSGDVTGESGARGQDLDAIKSVKKEITQIRDLLETHSQKVERHIALLENLPQHLWISQDSAYSAKQYLAPLALAAAEEVDKVLIEAASLFNTLTDVIANDVRSPLIESLQEEGGDIESFTEDELALSLKEAKRKYDGDALRKWKSARRKQIE
jgi:MoxR-like ATPase